MKTILILMLVIFSNSLIAQKALDTIYVNDQKNVAMFFPEPIRQGITGKDNFVFTYNREKAQYFGLLQATPGPDSNLLAITNDGMVYSYILKYKEQL
ncbi:MAG: conjugal transfer protein, partial [Gelidibacter sp.]|nr:conjugal transfer protein [Gelidibacter sp.]